VTARGFSLIEVMVAMGLGGVIVASAVTTFKYALDEQALAKREWQAFTIAQQQMEVLAALPTTHPLLVGNAGPANAGTPADAFCNDIPAGAQHFRTDGLGNTSSIGAFDVCYRITDGSPIGSKKNVRVVVNYDSGGKRHVILQSIR
jgi:prepilin-type N-terminal cleavage/methylation domain-containing protein